MVPDVSGCPVTWGAWRSPAARSGRAGRVASTSSRRTRRPSTASPSHRPIWHASIRPPRTRPSSSAGRSSSSWPVSPKESILSAFDLPVIGRYFPEYESTIRSRLTVGVPSLAMCEHYVARADGAVPDRRAVAVHRAARAVRHRRLRLGRGVDDWSAGRPADLLPRRPGVPRRPRRRGPGRGRRDDEPARPPSPAVPPLDARDGRHPAVRRPGRSVRLQPQRRPARLPAVATPLPGRGPDPRPRRHRGRGPLARGRLARRRAGRASPRRAPRHVRRPGEPRGPRRRRPRPGTTPGTRRTGSSRSVSGAIRIASTGIYSLDRSLFRLAAPAATDRRLVPLRATAAL